MEHVILPACPALHACSLSEVISLFAMCRSCPPKSKPAANGDDVSLCPARRATAKQLLAATPHANGDANADANGDANRDANGDGKAGGDPEPVSYVAYGAAVSWPSALLCNCCE